MARVKDFMSRHIVAVSRSTSIGSAIRLMKEAHVSVLPVLNGTTLAGLLTMREIEGETETKKVGETNLRLLYAEANDTAESAAKTMILHGLNRLPVVESVSSMECVGIVSATEIAKSHKKRIF